jgi:adhesin transport system membrane fusion protein
MSWKEKLAALRGVADPKQLSVAEAGQLGEVKKASTYLLYVISAITVGLMLWAYFASVETVARSQGRVITSGKIQLIQNLEGGIVSAIHVKAGQRVAEGTLLVSLSETQFDSDLQSRLQQANALAARLARLNAESEGVLPVFDAQVMQAGKEFVDLERNAFETRAGQLKSQLDMLQAQIEQKTQELQENRIALSTASRMLALGREEREILSRLVAKGLEPKLELVRLDRTLADAEGREETARSAIKRLQSGVDETMARKDSAVRQFRSDARAESNKTLAEYRSLKEILPSLKDKKGRTEMRSPVAGIVNRVMVNTVGGVVKPGEPIVEVVPVDEQLVLEANVLPSDIGFVKVGQMANVKLTAYDYSIFGSLIGKVVRIAPDSVTNEKGESFYVARIETSSTMEVRGNKFEVMPGMQAQVDIITGHRTIWEYLSKPLVAVKENAFRER